MLKELTRLTIKTIENRHNSYKDKLTDSEIKEKILEEIRLLNYGNDQKSYFWITDQSPKMLMHPYKKDLEGLLLSDFKDINGIKLFQNALNIVNENGEGFLEYHWQWQDDSTKILPKITFVKLYKPWGWIVGTGIYVNDIETELSNLRQKEFRITMLLSIIMLLMILIAFYIGYKSEKQRKYAQFKLQQNEKKFRTIFHDSNDTIIISDFHGIIIDINNKALEMYDLEYNNVVGKKNLDLIDKKYHNALLERLKVIAHKELDPIEVELTIKNKKNVFVEIKSSISTFDNKPVVLSILRDISAKKMQEKELIESQLNYKIVAEYNSDWEYWISPNREFLYISPSCEKISGYSPDEFKSDPQLYEDIIVDEDKEIWNSHHINAMENHIGNDIIQYRIKTKQGSIIWIEHSCQPVYDNENNYIGARGSNRNITERIKARENLIKVNKSLEISESKFKTLSDVTFEGIAIHKYGFVIDSNLSFSNMFGYEREALLGRDVLEKLFEKTSIEKIKTNIQNNSTTPYEVIGLKKDGSKFPVEIEGKTYYSEGINKPLRVTALRDITEKKQAELRLFNAIIDTEENERKKFAEDLHDELGPHLSGIRLYINELEDESITVSRRNEIVKMLDLMVKEAIDKTRTISNQLMPSILTDYGLIKALQSFCTRITNTSAINITFGYGSNEFAFSKTTEIVIYRVIIELINNTLKHACAKNISIEISKNKENIYLVYKDDGKGFDLDEALKNKKGLGISNVINRMKSIESSYQFESNPQKGIIFSFTFSPNT